MHLDNRSYNFDSRFVLILYDQMNHFKEQDSSIGNLGKDFLTKYNNIIECLKQIAGLQNTAMDNQFKVNIIVKGKEEMYGELSKEFDRINDEIGKEIETMKVMFIESLEK